MKQRYMLIAGGVDRKGIVYKLTNVLKEFNFNIEDSSMIMLRRTFSVIMLLSADLKAKSDLFDAEINKFSKKYEMTMEIKKITENEMKEYSGEDRLYVISISGADKPGIVNAITKKLYEAGANIVDLETKSSEKVTPHAYYMFLEVTLPKKINAKRIQTQLVKEGKRIGVHVSFSEADKSIL